MAEFRNITVRYTPDGSDILKTSSSPLSLRCQRIVFVVFHAVDPSAVLITSAMLSRSSGAVLFWCTASSHLMIASNSSFMVARSLATSALLLAFRALSACSFYLSSAIIHEDSPMWQCAIYNNKTHCHWYRSHPHQTKLGKNGFSDPDIAMRIKRGHFEPCWQQKWGHI